MSLSATIFGRDSFIHKATNILGLGIPGWLDRKFGPKPIEGPRLDDLSVQSSAYGLDIPRTYAKIGVTGNLVWLENNQLKEKVHKKKSGGKGGGSQKPTKTYTYSATFMIAITEGPIEAIGRIWCGDKLIYNPNVNDLPSIIASNQAAAGFRVYLGTDSQLPDPRMEAALGVGNTPAYRGLAYVVFYDFELADYGNSLQGAQFKFEVFQYRNDDSPEIILNSQVNTNVNPSIPWAPCGTVSDGGISVAWDGGDTLTSVDSYGSVSVAGPFSPDYAPGTIQPTPLVQSPSAKAGAGLGDVTPTSPLPSGGFYHTIRGWEVSTGGKFKFHAVTPSSLDFSSSSNFQVVEHPNGGEYYAFLNAQAGTVNFVSKLVSVGNWPDGSTDASTIPLYTVPAKTAYFAFHGDRCYCIGPGDLESIAFYTLSSAFSVISKVDLPDSTSFTGTFPINGAYCDGTTYYAYYGTTITSGGDVYEQLFKIDVATGAWESLELPSPTPGNPQFNFGTVKIQNQLLYRLTYSTPIGGGQRAARLVVYNLTPYSGTDISLADLVEAECGHSQLINADDLDTSELIDFVHGYRIDGQTIRGALEPLALIFPFDVIMSGYKIKFVRRGKQSAKTIPYGHLGATQRQDHVDVLTESLTQQMKLPTKTTISYIDADREYSVTEQYYEKPDPNNHNVNNEEMTIVLTADEAAQKAEVVTLMAWLQKSTFEFSLPHIYSDLEPADVITIQSPYALYEFIIMSIEYGSDGRLDIRATNNSAAAYTSVAVGQAPSIPPGTVVNLGPSFWLPLDIPVIQDDIQNTLGFVTLAGSGQPSWPGCTLVQTIDGGQTWNEIQGYNGFGSLGNGSNILSASACVYIDPTMLRVVMRFGELDSITRDQMLAGVHWVAYGIDGRWEIMRFQTAALVEPNVYEVSNFIRGECGTEWATGLHQIGDYFVLLDDPDNTFIGMPISSLLVPRTYRAVTSGADIDTAEDIDFTYRGVNLECLSPVYPHSSRDTNNDLTFSIQRRSRLGSSWWVNGMEAPVGETSLAFECDVMDGSTVVRTLTSSDGTFFYSHTDQNTDFGSHPPAITVRIYQLSSVMGRGYPLETIV